jgi:hypothetical protein
VIKRAMIRDINYFGTKENLLERYNKRYIPGQKLYFKRCNPKESIPVMKVNEG